MSTPEGNRGIRNRRLLSPAITPSARRSYASIRAMTQDYQRQETEAVGSHGKPWAVRFLFVSGPAILLQIHFKSIWIDLEWFLLVFTSVWSVFCLMLNGFRCDFLASKTWNLEVTNQQRMVAPPMARWLGIQENQASA